MWSSEQNTRFGTGLGWIAIMITSHQHIEQVPISREGTDREAIYTFVNKEMGTERTLCFGEHEVKVHAYWSVKKTMRYTRK